MKVTTNLPDDLYRRVKARSATLGLTVRDITVDLYRRWLQEPDPVHSPAPTAEQWLDTWIQHGVSSLGNRPECPTATEILAADRNRLDPD